MKRVGATGLISLIGLALFVPNAVRLASLHGPATGVVLAGVGALLAAVLVGVGYLLARSEFTAVHTLRVAGWAALGTVLLGFVRWVVDAYGGELRPDSDETGTTVTLELPRAGG